ncbi:MAG: A/G-specific adenine glycosylase [Spirochaetales bacterium]
MIDIPEHFSRQPTVAEFQKIILEYFEQYARKFPWRETENPYEILVSEIMLQQTQTERVVPKYFAWLTRFPDVHTLAQASLADVLTYWSGLGYNRRARFLHEAARELSKIMYLNKEFPQSPTELVKLPGIGSYTAHAVATFAFNRPEVFIETNIRSVYLFFFFREHMHTADKVHDKDIFPFIEKTLYRKNPRLWYYALMDYGAALKKTVKNPNRQSTHYIKQSPFEGSVRQARGAILRQLTGEHAGNAMNLNDIHKAENIDLKRLERAAELLCAEKLLYKDGDFYKIP